MVRSRNRGRNEAEGMMGRGDGGTEDCRKKIWNRRGKRGAREERRDAGREGGVGRKNFRASITKSDDLH